MADKKKKKTEVATVEPKKVAFSSEQINLIKRTVAKGATDDELKLFLIIANKSGLDPFSRQIHFVKRNSKQGEIGTIQTGIDGYRAVAERSGQYAGSDDIVFITKEDGSLERAMATVYRIVKGVRVPFTATAYWKEFVPPAPNNFMWSKMPHHMLGKVAEALALRKAFPNDLSGIYVDEEAERIGAVVTDPGTVTVEKTAAVGKSTVTSDNPHIAEFRNQADPLEPLWKTARDFGAVVGQEDVFVQQALDMDIDVEALRHDPKAISNIRTQLLAKLTPRNNGNHNQGN